MARSANTRRFAPVLLAALAVLPVGGCRHAAPADAPAPADAESGTKPREGRVRAADVASAEDLKGVKVARAEELLAGRFAGVQVTRLPGGGISVRIRGATSLQGSSEPLFVVDGMPVEPGPGGALQGIAPEDVARIEVLKDIGSTSFYGVRGANGVVLITTRGGP
ncbi:MAG TPA: TonB-dependent receptor plug domain-containing protein [Longimicrobiaceae bacterium]|nr:TonB-dependent receptor plug domain-containing protein [Longimicrobiaceae bacterium]